MHGGLGSYIARRGNRSVGIDPNSVNWTDIDARLVVGITTRHTTQQITGISAPVTLQLYRRYGPFQTEDPLENGSWETQLYYRIDATEPTIASNFNPAVDGWTPFPDNGPCTLVVENGDWVSFGVAESPWTLPVDHVVVVKNVTQDLATVDDFGVRLYVEIAGGSNSSSNSTSSATSSTTSSATSSTTSSATSSTTSSTSSGTSGGSGSGGGGQAPPPEDP